MSDANLQVGIDAGGAVAGSRTVVRSLDDIYSSATILDTKLRGLESTLGRVGANPGLTQAKAAMQQLERPMNNVVLGLERIESRIIRIGATVVFLGSVGAAFGGIIKFVTSAIKSTEDYQTVVIGLAASLTQVAIVNNNIDKRGRSIGEMYQESARYANVLAEKMREVDKNSLANYDQIMAALQAYTATGKVLQVNNKYQMEGFTALTNAIPLLTSGQDPIRQMTSEMRAFATGTKNAGSAVANTIDSMLKTLQDDKGMQKYKNGLKDLHKEAKALGKDVLELVGERGYLAGFTAAVPSLQKALSTARTSFQTEFGIMQREAFKPFVKDYTDIIHSATDMVKGHAYTVQSVVQSAWVSVRDVIFDIAKSKDGESNVFTIKPQIIEALKTMGELLKIVGSAIYSVTSFLIQHADIISKLIVVYVSWKAVQLANYLQSQAMLLILNQEAKALTSKSAILAAHTEALAINNAMIIERETILKRMGVTETAATKVTVDSSIAMGAKMTRMAEEIDKQKATIALRQKNITLLTAEIAALKARQEAAISNPINNVLAVPSISKTGINSAKDAQVQSAANLELTKTNLDVAKSKLTVMEASLAESIAARNLIQQNLILQQSNLRSLQINAALATETAVQAQTRSAEAAAKKAANLATIESLMLEKQAITTNAASAASGRDLAIVETELATAKARKGGLTSAANSAEIKSVETTRAAAVATELLTAAEREYSTTLAMMAKTNVQIKNQTAQIAEAKVAELAATEQLSVAEKALSTSKANLIKANFAYLASVENTVLSTNAESAALNKAAQAAKLNEIATAKLAAETARYDLMLIDANIAAERYNAILAKQGILISEVTGAKILNSRARFENYGYVRQAIAIDNAHTAALKMNTTATIENTTSTAAATLGQRAYAAAVGGASLAMRGLGALFSALGGWITVAAVGIYSLVVMWNNYGKAVREANAEMQNFGKSASDKANALYNEIALTKKLSEIKEKETSGQSLSAEEATLKSMGTKAAEYNELLVKRAEATKKAADARKELNRIDEIGDSKAAVEIAKKDTKYGGSIVAARLQLTADKNLLLDTVKSNEKAVVDFSGAIKMYEGLAKGGYLKEATPKSSPGAGASDDKKGKKSEAEQALERLRLLQDQYSEAAVRSGKAVDELGSKLALLDEQLKNDLKQNAAAMSDPKTKAEAQQIKEKMIALHEVKKAYLEIEDTKKGQEAYDKAAEAASLQEYKSNLDYRKSELQRHLEDKEISQQQYFKFMGDMILEESAKEILAQQAQQKVVDAKKAALSEAASKGIFSGDFKKAQAELITAESALDKVRQDASKRYEDNLRAQIKLLEETRKATLALESKNAVDEARLASDSYSNSGLNPFKQIELELAAEKAAIKAKYDMERDEIVAKYQALEDGTESQLAAMGRVHEQQMIYIDAENEKRIAGITNKDQRLAEEKRYAEASAKIDSDKAKKSADLQTKYASQVSKFKTALEKAFSLTFEKQKQEEVKTEKKAADSKMTAFSAYAELGASALNTLAEAQDKSSREGFEAAKNYSLAAAIMSTAAAIVAQLMTPGPVGWVKAALAAATGAIQIATISSTSYGGGGSAPSAPAGSFASTGAASSNGTGLSNIKAPLMSLEDTRTAETYERMIASSDSVVEAIGRLSKSLDDLTAIFEEGGAGYALATNAPQTALTVGGTQKNPFGTSALIGSLGNALGVNGVESFFKTVGTLGIADIVESMFASENKITESGMALAVQNGMIMASEMLRRETGNWWSGSKTHYEYKPNEELKTYMDSLIMPFMKDIENMAMTLGTTVDFSKFSSDLVNIQVAGKTAEEVAKQLEDWTVDTLQGLSLTVQGLAGDGGVIGNYDDAYAALKRLNDGIVTLKDSFLLIGKTVVEGTLANAQAADALITSMGGIDDFNEAIDSYFSSMFTDAEQDAARTAEAKRKVDSAFTEMDSLLPKRYESILDHFDAMTNTAYMNVVESASKMPQTREEFRSLVNAQDVTSESGAALFASLTSVSKAFGTLMDAADEAAAKLKEIQQATEDLDVRYLKATGQDDAASTLERQLSAQREIEQAYADKMGQPYIDRLREVLALEAITTDAMKDYTDQRRGLQDQLNILTGKTTQRELDLLKLKDAESIRLQNQIWRLQDLKAITAAEKALADQRQSLQEQLEIATGKRVKREIELKKITDELSASLQKQIWAAEDLAKFNNQYSQEVNGYTSSSIQGQSDLLSNAWAGMVQSLENSIEDSRVNVYSAFDELQDGLDRRTAAKVYQATVDAGELELSSTGVNTWFNSFINSLEGFTRDLYENTMSSPVNNLVNQFKTLEELSTITVPVTSTGAELRQWYTDLVLATDDPALKSALLQVQDQIAGLATAMETEATRIKDAAESQLTNTSQLARQKRDMEIQIMELEGKTVEALVATREIELKNLDATLQPLQVRVWALQDEAEATATLNAINEKKYDLETQIMRLRGDELGATIRERNLALKELENDELRNLQKTIWQLEDAAKAADKATSDYNDNLQKLKDNLATAESDLRAAFSAEKDRLTEAYQAELEALNTRLDSAKTVVADLTDSLNMLTSARKAMRLEDEAYQRNQYLIARQQLSTVLDQAAGGDLSGVKNMGESLDILTSQGQEAYANSTDYQRDFYIVTDSIEKLESYTKKSLTPAEQTVTELERQSRQLTDNHNAQMRAMDNQLNALLGIDTTAKTIAQALSAYNAAKAAADAAAKASATNTATSAAAQRYGIYHTVGGATIFHQGGTSNYLAGADAYDRLTSIFPYAPRFALGGITSGISIAGEAGPEAVVPLPDGRRIPVQMTGAADNRELVEEIKALNARIDRLTAATGEVSKATQKTAKLIDQWDGDGMPEVRTA